MPNSIVPESSSAHASQAGAAGAGVNENEELNQQGTAGAGAGSASSNEGQGDGSSSEGRESSSGTEGSESTPQGNLSAEAIAAIVKSTIEGVVPRQQGEGEQRVSPEELRKQLNVYDVSEDVIARVLKGGPDGVAAMTEIVDGIARQAVTMANYRAQQMLQEIVAEISPMRSYYKEQQMSALRNEFMEKNPDLKGYEVICNAVKDQLLSSGFKGTKEEVFKAVASGARKVIKGLPGVSGTKGGGESGQGGNGAAAGGQQQQRKMSTLMQGGRGSNALQSAGSRKGPSGVELFR